MNSNQIITLFAAGMAFVASIIATGVAIYNARFSRWAKERQWERKADAYARLIDSLSHLAYYYHERLSVEEDGKQLSDEGLKKLNHHWEQGYAEAKRAAVAGAFLISSEAQMALQKFWKEKEKGVHPNDFYGLLDANAAAASKCLESVVVEAKNDLLWQ